MLDRSLFFDEDDLTNRCWHVIDVLVSNIISAAYVSLERNGALSVSLSIFVNE